LDFGFLNINKGRQGSRRIGRGAGCPFCQCSTKNQNPNTGFSHHWGGFLLVLFSLHPEGIHPYKENELGCLAETGLKIQLRDSDSN